MAQSLYRRRLAAYCLENRVDEADLTKEVKTEVLAKSKAMYEEFLSAVIGKKTNLDKSLFELSTPAPEVAATEPNDDEPAA